jgi:hypothetical protein
MPLTAVSQRSASELARVLKISNRTRAMCLVYCLVGLPVCRGSRQVPSPFRWAARTLPDATARRRSGKVTPNAVRLDDARVRACLRKSKAAVPGSRLPRSLHVQRASPCPDNKYKPARAVLEGEGEGEGEAVAAVRESCVVGGLRSLGAGQRRRRRSSGCRGARRKRGIDSSPAPRWGCGGAHRPPKSIVGWSGVNRRPALGPSGGSWPRVQCRGQVCARRRVR